MSSKSRSKKVKKKLIGKTLIAYSTKSGVNAQAADAISDVLNKNYNMDVTIHDLGNGSPDIMPFQNIIVGGGVKGKSVYGEAVDFLGKNFEGKNVALYFCCEDNENPTTQSTEENTKKALVKNPSLKPVDVVAFGGCMINQGKAVMDTLNMNRVTEWANDMGKKFIALEPMPPVEAAPVVEKTPEPMPPVEVMPIVETPVKAKETEGVFEIICDAADRWRFHLKAANGEIIAASQSYGSKEAAEVGIASIKKNAPIAKIVDLTLTAGMPDTKPATGIVQDPAFEIFHDIAEKFRFHLKAANGEIILASQSYGSKEAAEVGIASIKKNAPIAKIVELKMEAT